MGLQHEYVVCKVCVILQCSSFIVSQVGSEAKVQQRESFMSCNGITVSKVLGEWRPDCVLIRHHLYPSLDLRESWPSDSLSAVVSLLIPLDSCKLHRKYPLKSNHLLCVNNVYPCELF